MQHPSETVNLLAVFPDLDVQPPNRFKVCSNAQKQFTTDFHIEQNPVFKDESSYSL